MLTESIYYRNQNKFIFFSANLLCTKKTVSLDEFAYNHIMIHNPSNYMLSFKNVYWDKRKYSNDPPNLTPPKATMKCSQG